MAVDRSVVQSEKCRVQLKMFFLESMVLALEWKSSTIMKQLTVTEQQTINRKKPYSFCMNIPCDIFKHTFIYFCYSSDSEKRENRNETAKEKSEKKHQSKLGKNGILKFDTIRCDALDPKVLLYNRIFKTGSSTTESLIMSSSSRMNYAYKIGKGSTFER